MPERDLEYTIRFELSNVVRFSGGGQDELLFDYAPLPGDQQHGRRRLLRFPFPGGWSGDIWTPSMPRGFTPRSLRSARFRLPWVCPREGGVCYLSAGTEVPNVLIFEAEDFRVARQIGVNLAPLLEEVRSRLGGDIGTVSMTPCDRRFRRAGSGRRADPRVPPGSPPGFTGLRSNRRSGRLRRAGRDEVSPPTLASGSACRRQRQIPSSGPGMPVLWR